MVDPKKSSPSNVTDTATKTPACDVETQVPPNDAAEKLDLAEKQALLEAGLKTPFSDELLYSDMALNSCW